MQTAERYIRLAHGIDAHEAGYIDGYGGPAEWAERTQRSLNTLNAEADALAASVAAESSGVRRMFLEVQVRAMRVKLRLLAGEALDYTEEVHGLYDVLPLKTPESTFQTALDAMNAALPGSGSLLERQDRLRGRVALEQGDILRVAQPILSELRARTAQRFGLPEGESFTLELVQDKPWGGYNWPLGNLKSRIDINTDFPVLLPGLPDLMAHEGYPGHHTEHATKEARLVRERGWYEHSLQIINAPECVVSEGIAVNALRALMDEQELRTWLTGELSAAAGLDPEDVAAFLSAAGAREGLNGVSGNAALLLHQDGRPESEVLDYLMTYGLNTPERARQSLSFIQSPSYRSYIYTYTVGGELVRAAMAAGDAGQIFGRLLTEPLTPGQLAQMAG
ncbi:hypothetical protein [Deinococcus ruber]|uniref:DUF885 domain-containing protein n=1 Tax=Deinococcus ruber TaxID=1848197 RepID=A0A918BWQ2_9DEIO|nr:hypothetical protein [Deinococcus ruber]GGQ96588.1 hypothetical protein GCM10008957_06060 [Deinococcus ruber]